MIKKDKLLKFIHETVEPLKRSRNIPWAKNAFVEILWIIESANEKIIGWGGSYSFCNVSKTFTKLDDLIFKNISILCDKLRLSKNQKEIALKKIKKLAQLKSDPIIKS